MCSRSPSYRDEFYEKLLSGLSGERAERLRAEAATLRQPLGGARQHFNQCLARRRAEQLQYVNLALLFARMGYTEAAARQVRAVPVASARMKCDIYCRLTTVERQVEAGQWPQSPAVLEEVEDLLHRAIECGALVDPWNMLGFGGQYGLFPSPENSVYDHRIDDLIGMVSDIFGAYVRVEKEAAAAGDAALQEAMSQRLERLADWWDKYASTEVGSIEGVSGRQTRESADYVAAALEAWHRAGADAGDLAFWRGRAEEFRSPKAYALVVDALLEQRDPVAAMALLVQWLSQSAEIPLVEENYSFHDLALDWMEELWSAADSGEKKFPPGGDRWVLSRKFLDCIEANAEENWRVPQFELAPEETPSEAAAGGAGGEGAESGEEPGDAADNLFDAAYEGMTYRDSTDDGFEGETLETGQDPSDFELVAEAERIFRRLMFLSTLAQLWKIAAVASSAVLIAPTATRRWPLGWPRPPSTAANCWNCFPRSIATAFRRRGARRSR